MKCKNILQVKCKNGIFSNRNPNREMELHYLCVDISDKEEYDGKKYEGAGMAAGIGRS